MPPAFFYMRCVFYYLLSDSLASRRRISRYNQTMVTSKPNAPYHSMYFGGTALSTLFDHIEIKDEVEGGNTYYHQGKIMPMVLPS